MGRTDRFRAQHADLVKVVKDISAVLQPAKLATAHEDAKKQLASLAGKISMHLATEDQALYPSLVGHADPKIKDLANKYQSEMGEIRKVFEAYNKKWSTGTAIKDNPAGFCSETNELFKVLAKRIEREDNELYPMVDKAA